MQDRNGEQRQKFGNAWRRFHKAIAEDRVPLRQPSVVFQKPDVSKSFRSGMP